MIGDSKHKQIGSIVGGDVVAAKFELGEVVFVFDEGCDGVGHVIADTCEDVKAWSKGRFRSEISIGNIAHVEADTQTGIGLHFVLIAGDPNQRIKRE